ncbi:hypothetical protein [Shewanella spartinae]|uniref:hypothetical protein n=1 Tax=Shewanella spartinae TaxID=2864205 RepID=UPI001C660610|nr:hypothetical protein [Shewanella spartinae]QYJ95081.1 hypothetical protein K0I31_06775 [Shewanella spartinae]
MKKLAVVSLFLLSACGGSDSDTPADKPAPPPQQYSNVCIAMRVDYQYLTGHSYNIYGIGYTEGFNAVEFRGDLNWSMNSAAYFDWLVKTEDRRFNVDIFNENGFLYTAQINAPQDKDVAVIYMVFDAGGKPTIARTVEYLNEHPLYSNVTPCASYQEPINN